MEMLGFHWNISRMECKDSCNQYTSWIDLYWNISRMECKENVYNG